MAEAGGPRRLGALAALPSPFSHASCKDNAFGISNRQAHRVCPFLTQTVLAKSTIARQEAISSKGRGLYPGCEGHLPPTTMPVLGSSR